MRRTKYGRCCACAAPRNAMGECSVDRWPAKLLRNSRIKRSRGKR